MRHPTRAGQTQHILQTRPAFSAVCRALAAAGLCTATMLPLYLPGVVNAAETAAPLQAPAASRKAYDIPAGPLEGALNRFGRDAGILLSFPTDATAGLHSKGLSGSYSVQDALPLLLQGTGLAAVAQSNGGWALVKRAEPVARPAVTGAEATLSVVKVKASAERETATGPVHGYLAKRSATATKTDATLFETPQSISIVTAQQIEDTKATSIAEALAYTPGVLHDPGYSNSYDVIYSRGFRLHDGSGGVYRDGLKLGASGWATGQQEPYGAERIELLKGAASVLYGAAAPGGVLNIVTKQPSPDMVNELKVETGNYGHRAVAADLGKAWSDAWAGRVVALVRRADTMVDHIPNDTVYVAPSLRWTPSASTSLTLLAHHNERRTAYIYGVPVDGSLVASPYGTLPRNRFVGEPAFDRQDTRQHTVGYLFSHAFSDGVTLRHGLRYVNARNHIRFTALNEADAGDPRLWLRRAYDELETSRGTSADTSVQIRFDAVGAKHTLVAGTDQSSHKIGSFWDGASLAPLNLFAPVYGAIPGTFSDDGDGEETQQRAGLYLQDQLKLGRLTALIGARQDWARNAPVDGDAQLSQAFTGRAGAVYELDGGLAPFFSFSQSFEPQSGTDNAGNRYQPTRGEQTELGLRWQSADGALQASAALYRLQQTHVKSRRAGLSKPVQTGEVLSEGAEFEIKGRLSRHLSVIGSYAYTDAVTRKSEVVAEVGLPRPGMPRNQAALWLASENWLAPGLRFGLGARYVGTTEDWGGTRAEVPAFTTFDAMVGYAVGAWSMSVNVNNLTDKNTMICSYGYCTYGDGRRVTAQLGYRF